MIILGSPQPVHSASSALMRLIARGVRNKLGLYAPKTYKARTAAQGRRNIKKYWWGQAYILDVPLIRTYRSKFGGGQSKRPHTFRRPLLPAAWC